MTDMLAVIWMYFHARLSWWIEFARDLFRLAVILVSGQDPCCPHQHCIYRPRTQKAVELAGQAWAIPAVREGIWRSLDRRCRWSLLLLNKEAHGDLLRLHWRRLGVSGYMIWQHLPVDRQPLYATFITQVDLRGMRCPIPDSSLPSCREYWNFHPLDPEYILTYEQSLPSLLVFHLDTLTLERATRADAFKATHHLTPSCRTLVKDPPREITLGPLPHYPIGPDSQYAYRVKPLTLDRDRSRYHEIDVTPIPNRRIRSTLVADFNGIEKHFARPMTALAIPLDADLGDLLPFFTRQHSDIPIPGDLTVYCTGYDKKSLEACCEAAGSSFHTLELGPFGDIAPNLYLHELFAFDWSTIPPLRQLRIFVRMTPTSFAWDNFDYRPTRATSLRQLFIVVHGESSLSAADFASEAIVQGLAEICGEETEVEIHSATHLRKVSPEKGDRQIWAIQQIAYRSTDRQTFLPSRDCNDRLISPLSTRPECACG